MLGCVSTLVTHRKLFELVSLDLRSFAIFEYTVLQEHVSYIRAKKFSGVVMCVDDTRGIKGVLHILSQISMVYALSLNINTLKNKI